MMQTDMQFDSYPVNDVITERIVYAQSEGGSKEEQEQLLLAHQKELQTLVNKIDTDKLRMQSNLQDRLKKRR